VAIREHVQRLKLEHQSVRPAGYGSVVNTAPLLLLHNVGHVADGDYSLFHSLEELDDDDDF